MDLVDCLHHDFDNLETLLVSSPKEELNKPRKSWKGGNVLHGIVHLTHKNQEEENIPSLMECEHEQWLYLLHVAKQNGTNVTQKNENDETPLELLQKINHEKTLTDVVEIVLKKECNVVYD